MNNIPIIGSARGIFEILIPGVFTLANLVAMVYLFPFTDDETKELIAAGVSNVIVALALGIILGYLIGVILRLFRVELPDKASAKWLQRLKAARNADGTFKLWAVEEFPYIGWLGERYRQTLPPEVVEFYDKVWTPRKIKGSNRAFFNFCKTIIICSDEKYANEIYAAEALSRYISGMFYALVFVFGLMLIVVVLHLIVFGKVATAIVVLLLAYFVAIIAILHNFRFIRMKEVEIVITASFQYN